MTINIKVEFKKAYRKARLGVESCDTLNAIECKAFICCANTYESKGNDCNLIFKALRDKQIPKNFKVNIKDRVICVYGRDTKIFNY